MKNIKALLVDDDPRYAESFIDKAFLRDIEIVYKEDWESALTELKENFSDYAAVILDGKGKLSQDNRGDDPTHLSKALQDINLLRGEKNFIPYFINTAYVETLTEFHGTEKFFDKKKNQEDLLLNEITKAATINVIYRIKNKYSDVFACFGEKYLPVEASENLLGVLKQIENGTWSTSSFNSLRKIIEAIYKKLHEIDDELIPHSFMNFDRGTVNFEYCARRLTSGKEIRDKNGVIIASAIPSVVPKHLGWLIQPLDKICSICSHDYDDVRFVNIYSLKTVVFGIMEMILWFRKYIDENYENVT
jgi:hypothetical protein